jgi:serine/threonine protein kinase
MKPEPWQRIKEILGDALDLEPGAREAFVRDAANDDPSLLAELLRLVKESEHETDLLSRPILADAKALSQDEAPRFAPSAFLARRFRIVRFIARGGMGEVYEAEDVELNERVALKAIRQSIASDTGRALFKREIQLARRIAHPNVCRIFDLAQHEDSGAGEPVLLLSMEVIEGQTLSEYLRLQGPLTFRAALPLVEEIAAGLQAVHDAGVIHGDLKPGNVMP